MKYNALLVGAWLAWNSMIAPVYATDFIHINQGNHQPLALSVLPLGGDTSHNITQKIQNFLVSSQLFFSLGQGVEHTYSYGLSAKDLSFFKRKGFHIVITGQVKDIPGGLTATIHLFDVWQGKKVTTFSCEGGDAAQISAKVANQAYTFLTGLPGYFTSRIVYTIKDRYKRHIGGANFDGTLAESFVTMPYMTLSPSLSPSRRYLAFVSFKTRPAQVFVKDLLTQHTYALESVGVDVMTDSPQFTAQGDILYVKTKNKGSSIWMYEAAVQKSFPITQHKVNVIDTSPSMSPSNDHIVFNSDRDHSTPKLYILTRSTGQVRPLTLGLGRYFACRWSPDGQWITFVKYYQGAYYLGIIRPDGRDERLLISDYLIDVPAWRPDSRSILFSSQSSRGGVTHLYTVSLDGKNLQKISLPHQAAYPHWQ